MRSINKPRHLIVSAFAALTIVGTINTARADDATSSKGERMPVGIANPASVYCQERGGALRIIKDQKNGGQYGLCQLSAKFAFEEWCLYRQDHPVDGHNTKPETCPNMIGLLQ